VQHEMGLQLQLLLLVEVFLEVMKPNSSIVLLRILIEVLSSMLSFLLLVEP